MGVIKRQTIQGTIYSYIGVLLGFVNVVLLFPKILNTEQIGLVNLLVAISTIFAQFGSLGFNSVTTRLFSYFRDKSKNHNGFLFMVIMVSLAGTFLMFAIFYLLEPLTIKQNSSESDLFANYVNYNYLLIFSILFYLVFDNYLKVLFNSVIGTFYKEVVFRVLTFLNLVFINFGFYDFNSFVLIYVLSLCFPTFALLLATIIKGEFNLKPQRGFIDKQLKKQIFWVAFFGILSGVGGIAISNVDKYLVSSYLNLSLTGVYSISFFFGTLILIPSRSLTKISSPVLADAWKNNDLPTISFVYKKSCITQYIVGLLIFILLWANIENVFRLLPEEYASGRYVILFVALANLFEMVTGTSGMIIQTSRFYPYLTYFRGGSILILVVSNIILVPILGITGAALSVLITRATISSVKFWFIHSKYKMQPYDLNLISATGIGLTALLIAYFIPQLDSLYLDILLRSAIVGIIFLAGLIVFKPSDEINLEIMKYIAIVKKWINRQ